ncbi:MAG: CxxC-x17-CxxC domain-containing protein [Candidatus Paceibacterota bacterium]|jgi:CxxC-x17-CxxC domain-containing protein
MKDFKKTYSAGKRDFGAKRGPSFGHGYDRSDEPHKTTCDGCHAMCEVPFVPNGKKPVYCRNCYKGKDTTTSFTGQPFSQPTDFSAGDAGANDLKKQFSILNTKLDRLISAIEAQTRVLSGRE